LASNKLNFIFYAAGIIISGILSFLLIPIIVQLCGKEVYGTYSLIFNSLSVTGMFCYAWVGQSYIRFYSQKKNQLSSVSNKLLKKSLVIGFCFFVILSLIITTTSIVELVYFMPTFFLFGYYCFYVLVFQAKQKASLIMMCEILRTSINIIVAMILLNVFGTKHSIEILAIALFSSYLVPLIILHLKNKEKHTVLNELEIKAITKQIISFGIPIAFFLSGSLALSVNDRFIISKLVNKESAGTYSAIYDMINKGIIAIFSPILMTFYPIIANLYNNNNDEQAIKKINKLILFELGLMTSGFIVLVFVCPYLLELIFKQKVDDHLQKVTYLIFIGVCLWQIAMLAHKPLELKQKTKFMAFAVFAAFIINASANYFFLKNSTDLIIPAITTIVGSVVYITIVLYLSNKKMNKVNAVN
jgi:O-antigen/teichoic acid export membrane protein